MLLLMLLLIMMLMRQCVSPLALERSIRIAGRSFQYVSAIIEAFGRMRHGNARNNIIIKFSEDQFKAFFEYFIAFPFLFRSKQATRRGTSLRRIPLFHRRAI